MPPISVLLCQRISADSAKAELRARQVKLVKRHFKVLSLMTKRPFEWRPPPIKPSAPRNKNKLLQQREKSALERRLCANLVDEALTA